MGKYTTIPNNYDLELNNILEAIKNIDNEKRYIEIERPLKKIGNSYFVQIPIDIAKENNFEKIKVKIEDKKASEILNALFNSIEKTKNKKINQGNNPPAGI